MADKQIEISVKATTDSSQIEDLSNAMDELKTSAEEASNSIGGLSNEAGSVDSSGIDGVTVSADDASASIDGAESSTQSFNDNLGNIDGSGIDDVAGSAKDADESLAGASDSAMSMIDALVSAEIGSAVVSGFMSGADAAGSYGDSMVRLGYALNSSSMSAEQAQQKYGTLISNMASETGRGAGTVRQHLINMGNVGITNSQVLASSFEGVSKAAFQMGRPIEMLDGQFQKMVLSGNAGTRQLANFGIGANDMAKAMGVSAEEVSESFKSMDENSRASVLAMALNMKYGEDVNKNYKESYEHLSEEVQRAKDYFIRTVGEALLPYLIPAIKTTANFINTLAKGFKSLPGPVKVGIGAFVGLTAGLTSFGLMMSATIKMVSGASGPFIKLFNVLTGSNVKSLGQLASALKNIGVNALKSAYMAMSSAASWVWHKTVTVASTIATKLAAAAQWLLNVAMSANPIMIVVIAIIALIAVLTYLYFNNEQVRNAINGLGQALMGIGQIIYGAVINALNWLKSALEGLWNYIVTLGGLLPANVSITGNQIVDTILRVMIFIATLPAQLGMIFVNLIAKSLGFGDNFSQNMLKAGSKAVSNFINYISQIPSKLGAELENALNKVGEWASTLPQKFWDAGVNAVKNFLGALGIASPGTMQRMLVWEVQEMGNRVPVESKKLIRNIGLLGEDIVDSFGNPNFDLGFGVDNNSSVMSNSNSDIPAQVFNINLEIGSVDSDERVNEIVDAVRRSLSWDNATAGRTI